MPEIVKGKRPYREPDREIVIAEIGKNETTQLRVTLARFNNASGPSDTLQIREWFLWSGSNGSGEHLQEWRPTTKGVALNMELSSELMFALGAALEKEIEWLDE